MIGSVKRQLMMISLGLVLGVVVLTALNIRAQQKQQAGTPQSTPTPTPPRPALRVIRGVENPAGLEKFFRALSTVKRRIEPVRIMHFGDSHTAADILTAEIRRKFQAEFGDGGAGYMVPRNPMSTPRRGVLSGATSGWAVDGIGGRVEVNGIYGLAGIGLSTTQPDERAWIEAQCNHFEVYFLRQPGGGTIDITIDGMSVLEQPMSLASDAPLPDYFTAPLPADRMHRIEVRTIGTGKVRILGIVTEHIAPGVSYDVLGINGARAKRLVSWNDTAFVDNIVQRKPDLIIVAYGTNEVSDDDWTTESYQRMFAAILRRFKRAAPQASILVYGPPDRADIALGGRMTAMIEAQRRAALEVGAAFWSSYGAMGGPGSMDVWASMGLGQGDRVHLTKDGYIRMGSMFYEDVYDAYKKYLARTPRNPPRKRE
ncbi:MAG TPA: GDSL-type esterase/lipase family protein [Pyrinomonadaceae bacterium]|nr:GDSL-type esterase/lipase family protein [Pyrinomonadaceae bacterium]